MNRYVRRGSKGIALLDDTGDQLRLRYVFDLADTGTRKNSRDPWLWTLEDRHRIPVAAMLERRYGTDAADLPQQPPDAAGQLAAAHRPPPGPAIRPRPATSPPAHVVQTNRRPAPQWPRSTGATRGRRSAASVQIPCWRTTVTSTEGLPSSGPSPPAPPSPSCPGADTPRKTTLELKRSETFMSSTRRPPWPPWAPLSARAAARCCCRSRRWSGR